MVDDLGYRAEIGVTTPSSNTALRPEYDVDLALALAEGVTNSGMLE